jgi:flagellar basal body-associated protein FliL
MPGTVAYPGAGPSSGGLPGRDRGWIWLVAVMVVLLAAASAAGGWFFLSHRSHPEVRVATAPAGVTFVPEHVPPGYHASAQSCPS